MTLDMKPVVCPLFILFFRCLTWGRKEKERKEKKRKKEKIPIKKKGRLLVRWRAERANKTTRRRRRRRRNVAARNSVHRSSSRATSSYVISLRTRKSR